jgi:glycosyltransferase involved in cell wall biosynthesis
MSHLNVREDIKILFVFAALHSYVRRDLEILQRHFDVKNMRIRYLIPRRGRDALVFLRLLRGVLWADVVYSWFADWNAFFLVLLCMFLCKKCVVVVGGYEVVYEPEIDYGALLSLPDRLRVKFVLRHASKILAVSNSTVKEMLRLTRPRNFKVLYNGVNTQKFNPSGPKEDLVITCARDISDSYIKRKRLDTFVETSVYLPDVRFVLIGRYNGSIKRLRKIAGSNVMFTGYVSDDSLLHYCRRAKVYCQLSTHEGFGVALAEAMSCCCVPVVTRRYALPEVVGDTGFYVPYDDPKVTAEAVKKALKSDKGRKARERIKKHFSLEAREKKLIKEILDFKKY